MMDEHSRLKPERVEWHAVVTRADGSVEDHGLVSAYYKNPVRRVAYRLKQVLRKAS